MPYYDVKALATGLVIFCYAAGSILHAEGEEWPDEGSSTASSNSLLNKLLNPPVTRSASGRYLILGEDRLVAHTFGSWLEAMTEQTAKITGFEFPRDRILIRFLLPDASTFTNTAVLVQEKRTEANGVVFTISLPGTTVEMESILEPITGCLLHALVQSGSGMVTNIPNWLTCGIVQNVYPELRQRNMTRVLKEWREGQIPSVSAVIDKPGVGGENSRAVYGVFMTWLLSWDEWGTVRLRMLEQIQAGRTVDAGWVAEAGGFPGGTAGLEEKWDEWLIRQKRKVYSPGQDAEGDLTWLNAQLLLFHEAFDTSSNAQARAISVGELVEYAGDRDVREAARNRAVLLRVFSAGRSDEAREAADAYGKFLEAMAAGLNRKTLLRLLADAERRKAALEARVMRERKNSKQ